jgi:hypothetical protein
MAQGRLTASGAADTSQGKLLAEMAAQYGMTPATLALAWVLRQNGVIPLTMTSRPEHLRASVMAASDARRISDTDIHELSQVFSPRLAEVPTGDIAVAASHTGRFYRTLKEAIDNPAGFSPSPCSIAKTLRSGDLLKPVKLRRAVDGAGYELFEGQLRYWAWVIAHDGKKPIPASIHNESGQ